MKLRQPSKETTFSADLQAQRDGAAAKPTRILTSKHQQEGLSGKQVRARFTDSQSSLPTSSHSSSSPDSSSSPGSRSAQHAARQPQEQDHQHRHCARRHAGFPDFAIVQPYSVAMFAWSVCLVCTGVSLQGKEHHLLERRQGAIAILKSSDCPRA